MSKLKHNIQRVLNDRGLSLTKLAQLSGVQQSTLHRIVTGTINDPRSSTIEPLAQFLGVTVQTLLYGELPAQVTFHNSTSAIEHPSLHQSEPATKSRPADWDRDSHLREFLGYFSNSAPPEYLNWRRDIEGNNYHLDYCSARLATDLICFSRPAPASHPKAGEVDLSGLFNFSASHLVNLFMIHAAFPNLSPLLLILCPVTPDEAFAPVRKLLASARHLDIDVRFATSGSSAIQAVLKKEAELLDDSTTFSDQ